MIDKPKESEYAPFYAGYIAAVPPGDDILDLLESQVERIRRLAASVPAERETFRYAPGKWTLREVLGHLGDAERVFGYRAFRISRGDETPLAGFDENQYVEASGFNARELSSLAEELALLRQANVLFLRSLDAESWRRTGIANNNPVSVRALAFIMAGHLNHHLNVLRERYGVEAG
jgi:hypothetical protein